MCCSVGTVGGNAACKLRDLAATCRHVYDPGYDATSRSTTRAARARARVHMSNMIFSSVVSTPMRSRRPDLRPTGQGVVDLAEKDDDVFDESDEIERQGDGFRFGFGQGALALVCEFRIANSF